jgi:hypothetical protein
MVDRCHLNWGRLLLMDSIVSVGARTMYGCSNRKRLEIVVV